jgi:hypothetical protein
MSLFRSEEHVARWLRQTSRARGEVISLAQVWQLSRAFYKDPRDPAWRPRTMPQTQAVLDAVGLTGEFWQLPRP